jgi:L-seryl-tRNA(Ser) seleniumtransferase
MRGKILAGTEDDFAKLEVAWSWIRRRSPGSIHIFTGLEHSLPMAADELEFADDEISPALYFERLKELTFRYLGGSPDLHDIAVFNRLTGATMGTHRTLVKPGEVVIGVSESHSHLSVVRAAEHTGARFIDTAGLAAFRDAMAVQRSVALVVLTRLAVTYDLMPLAAIRTIVQLAHDKGALVYMDDAGGARVGPAAFEQPRMLELGVDIGATGLDKYGTKGPRLGLLAGRKDLVAKIRAKGFEFGMEARQMLYPAVVRTLEQYDPDRVRALIQATKQIGEELRLLLGNRLRETPTTVRLPADDILEIAMDRAELPSRRSSRTRRLQRSRCCFSKITTADGPFRRRASRNRRPFDQIRSARDPRALRRIKEICRCGKRVTDKAGSADPRPGSGSRIAAGDREGLPKRRVRPAGLKFEQPGYAQRSRRFQRRG